MTVNFKLYGQQKQTLLSHKNDILIQENPIHVHHETVGNRKYSVITRFSFISLRISNVHIFCKPT